MNDWVETAIIGLMLIFVLYCGVHFGMLLGRVFL